MKEFSKKDHTKEKSVKSLDEFVRLLNRYPSSDYFFRGENGYYNEREASAFRGHHGGWKSEYRDFMDTIDAYYSEVSYRLGEAEKSHFLAFSQHHGIPTNLVDVSKSPLTALYFACSGDDSEGYVYLFDNEHIDITSMIKHNPRRNFVELILEKDQYVISEFMEQIEKFEQRFPKSFLSLFDCLISDLKHYLGKPLHGVDVTKLKTFRRKRCNDFTWKTDNGSIAYEINKEEKYVDFDGDIFSLKFIYSILTIHLLNKLRDYGEYLYWLNWLPAMVYKPDMLFERTRIQHGFFIVQAFMHHIEPVYNVDVLARQRILFNQRIKISNTKSILQELNNIGINRATIFGDFDNIAKQVVNDARM